MGKVRYSVTAVEDLLLPMRAEGPESSKPGAERSGTPGGSTVRICYALQGQKGCCSFVYWVLPMQYRNFT